MKTIKKMYEHLNWSNKRILETLHQIEGDKRELCRLFSHILFAENVWITRLKGFDSSKLPLWSDVDVVVCEELVKQNEKILTAFLNNLEDAVLDKRISYKNSTGKEFNSSIRDVLTHVALHGQYHRGQINARLRANGFEPVNVDFITFVR